MSKEQALRYEEFAAESATDEEGRRFEDEAILALAGAARDLANRCGWPPEHVIAAVAEALAPDSAPLTPEDDPPF
jgi:hypothetical protein